MASPTENRDSTQPPRLQRRGGGGFGSRDRDRSDTERGQGNELSEKVVAVNRTAKVVKGGRRFHFSALVVVGDGNGRVGYGMGKANEVADAIRKANEIAKRRMVKVPMVNSTIPHAVESAFDGGRVLLRPASPGTGVIAGGGVRAVVEAAGIKDLLSKSLGSSNSINVVKATMTALMSLRPRDEIFELRGIQKNN